MRAMNTNLAYDNEFTFYGEQFRNGAPVGVARELQHTIEYLTKKLEESSEQLPLSTDAVIGIMNDNLSFLQERDMVESGHVTSIRVDDEGRVVVDLSIRPIQSLQRYTVKMTINQNDTNTVNTDWPEDT